MQKTKPVIQRDLSDCGVCCMEWIINYYDGYISLEQLREDTFTNSSGTTAYNIVETFKKWGFDSLGVLEKDLLSSRLFFPLIAHVVLKNGLKHFVVIKNISNKKVFVMDPGKGYIHYTYDEFQDIYTGYAILMKPIDKIIKMNKEISIVNIFISIIKKEKSLVIKIFISTIIWTLFIIINSFYLKIASSLLALDINLIKYLIISFGVFMIIKNITLYIKNYYINHLNNLIDVYIYPEFLRHIFSLPLKNIKNRSTGEIMTRVNELGMIKELISSIFISCLLDSFIFIISILVLFMINSKLLLIYCLFLIIYIIYTLIISKIIYQKIVSNINYQTDFNSILIENINMLESIKNINIVSKSLKRIEYKLSKLLLCNYDLTDIFNRTNLIKEIILDLGVFIINSVGIILVYNKNLSIIDLFTFNIIFTYSIDPVKNVMDLIPKFNYIKASFKKISEFISIKEEVYTNTSSKIKGDIVISNISFSYNGYNNILSDFNLCIKYGEKVFLFGRSGCGKSTICKILYKYIEDYKGIVTIGEINLKDISLSKIRGNILYISQNEEIFSGSIRDNIILDRNINDKSFQKVCDICEIESIVSNKGLRYESIVEPSAKNLSGGEKQRIILARGLLKNTNYIILDEALSEVDYNLESKIIENIKEYYKDKTIIYISHKNFQRQFERVINIG